MSSKVAQCQANKRAAWLRATGERREMRRCERELLLSKAKGIVTEWKRWEKMVEKCNLRVREESIVSFDALQASVRAERPWMERKMRAAQMAYKAATRALTSITAAIDAATASSTAASMGGGMGGAETEEIEGGRAEEGVAGGGGGGGGRRGERSESFDVNDAWQQKQQQQQGQGQGQGQGQRQLGGAAQGWGAEASAGAKERAELDVEETRRRYEEWHGRERMLFDLEHELSDTEEKRIMFDRANLEHHHAVEVEKERKRQVRKAYKRARAAGKSDKTQQGKLRRNQVIPDSHASNIGKTIEPRAMWARLERFAQIFLVHFEKAAAQDEVRMAKTRVTEAIMDVEEARARGSKEDVTRATRRLDTARLELNRLERALMGKAESEETARAKDKEAEAELIRQQRLAIEGDKVLRAGKAADATARNIEKERRLQFMEKAKEEQAKEDAKFAVAAKAAGWRARARIRSDWWAAEERVRVTMGNKFRERIFLDKVKKQREARDCAAFCMSMVVDAVLMQVLFIEGGREQVDCTCIVKYVERDGGER
jgi:hypothetical protein